MNTSRLFKHFTLGACILGAVLTVAPAGAQTAGSAVPAGKYVFSESGPAFTSLAQLTVAADGTITGQELLRTGDTVSTYVIQGTFAAQANQAVAMSLNATSADATDANGDPLAFSESVQLVGTSAGEFASLRTDTGFFGTGALLPAAAAVPKGAYLMSSKPVDPAAVSVEIVNLDGAGNVSGSELYDSFGVTNVLALSGSYASLPNGFQSLTLNGQATDSDGNSISSAEAYAMLPTQKDLRVMRIDAGPAGILILNQ